MRNDILEAYNKGLRIRKKDWGISEWIKKHSNTKSINSYNSKHPVGVWAFHSSPEYWEIFHEDVKSETQTNAIVEAYEQGKRISRKDWQGTIWIKKHSDTESIDGSYNINPYPWSFRERPEEWEIWHEDVDPEETTEPQTDAIQQAIDLLKANGYEIYQITKTKL